MNTTLARRTKRPRPLLTKELRKRGRLSAWMMYKVYAPIANLVASTLALPLLIALEVTTGHWHDVWFGTVISADCVVVAWSTIWIIIASGNRPGSKFSNRRKNVSLDELRRTRAHRDLEQTRLRDLDHAYPRYSILVEREGSAVVLVAVKHDWRGHWPLISWSAETTKRLYDIRSGHWADDRPVAEWKVANPTVDKLMERLGDAQLAVEELENNAYAAALENHRLDALALAMQPPPASAFSRARIAVEEDINDVLRELE